MPNIYNSLSAAQLVQLATTMDTILKGPGGAAYAVPAGQVTSLETTKTSLSNGIQTASDTKAAYHAAIQAKAVSKHGLVGSIAAIAKTVYANPAVTDTMLAAIGLAPRPSTRTRHDPLTPTMFIATPSVDGNVAMQWNKNGNVAFTTYLIEQLGANGWFFVKSVSGSRALLSGYAPGTTVSFRVVAWRVGVSSAPSNVSTIYPAGGEQFELQAA